VLGERHRHPGFLGYDVEPELEQLPEDAEGQDDHEAVREDESSGNVDVVAVEVDGAGGGVPRARDQHRRHRVGEVVPPLDPSV